MAIDFDELLNCESLETRRVEQSDWHVRLVTV